MGIRSAGLPGLPGPRAPPRGPTVVVRPDAPRWPPPARMRCSSVRGGKNPLATPGNSPGERSREVSRRIQEMWCGHHTIEVGVMWPSLSPAKPVPRGPSPDGSDASPPPWAAVPGGGGPAGGEVGGEGGYDPVLSLKPSPWTLPQPPHRGGGPSHLAAMLHPPSPLGIASGARARAGGRAGSRAPRSAGGSGGRAAGRGAAGEGGGALRALTSKDPGAPQGGREGGTLDGASFLLEVCVGRLVGAKGNGERRERTVGHAGHPPKRVPRASNA